MILKNIGKHLIINVQHFSNIDFKRLVKWSNSYLTQIFFCSGTNQGRAFVSSHFFVQNLHSFSYASLCSTIEVILLTHNVLSMNGKLKMKTSLLYFCFSTGLTTILKRLFDTNYRQFLTPPSSCCFLSILGSLFTIGYQLM